jgi:hypothetical protein
MKPEDQPNPKRGLSYELLLFVTIAAPFEFDCIPFFNLEIQHHHRLDV